MERGSCASGSAPTPSLSPTPTPTPGPSRERQRKLLERRRGLSDEAALEQLFGDELVMDSDSEGQESEGEYIDNFVSFTSKENNPDPDIVDLEDVDVSESVDESLESVIGDTESEAGDISDRSYEIPRRRTRARRLTRRASTPRRQAVRTRGRRGARSDAHEEGWQETDDFIPHGYIFDDDAAGMLPDSLLTEASRESEFFMNIMDVEVLDCVVTETNRFFEQLNALYGPFSSHSRMKRWKKTNIAEMYVFFALTLLMPHVSKHRVRDYWSTDVLVQTPIFRRYMTRDRYSQLSRFLHFTNNDNKEERKHDRLWKIRDVFDLIKKKLAIDFRPFQKLVIDESLILFKSRLIFKQYIKTKKSRFRIKIYVLCDCRTGMVLDMVVYTGTDIDIPADDPLGHSGSVVKVLMQPYLDNGHILYTDNFYTSPSLLEFLHSKNTGTVGTVRSNRRGMPSFPPLSRGQCVTKAKEAALAVRWRDKRDITIHPGQMLDSGKTDPVTHERVMKPDAVIDYTKNMWLVDKSDMQIASVDCMRRSIKWYKKLFYHLVDVALLNAFNLCKLQTGSKISMRVFSLRVVRQLLEVYGTPLHRGRTGRKTGAASAPDRLSQPDFVKLHHLAKLPPSTGRKTGQRNCHVCQNTKKRPQAQKKTSTWCPTCNVGGALSQPPTLPHPLSHSLRRPVLRSPPLKI